jgi:hypothetical protein
MNTNTFNDYNTDLIERLRDLARQGKTVAEMVTFINSNIISCNNITILKYFMKSFNLTLREARSLEDAPCMGNEALSDDELNSILRPLILERLSTS